MSIMQKLTVRPVNRKTGHLPADTVGRGVLLMRITPQGVLHSQKFTEQPTLGGMHRTSVHPYPHYIVLPTNLSRP